MKTIGSYVLSILVVVVFSTSSIAGVFEQNCQMCHGVEQKKSVAKLSKYGLIKKFKTKKKLVAAAMVAIDTDMEVIRDDVRLLEDAAADIGLK